MDDKFLKIFTQLKANTNTQVTITYYNGTKRFENQKFKLIDIIGFSHILLNRGQKNFTIDFFGPNTAIESITLTHEHTPIFFNPHIRKYLISKNIKISYQKIKGDFFGPNGCDKDLEKRGNFLTNYVKRRKFTIDQLFFSDKQKQEFIAFLNLIIQELEEYAKEHGFNPQLIETDSGTTSIIYTIGDKILKIGKPRTYSIIPYCEYLLQPIINREFKFEHIPIHIEITQKVITKSNEPKFEEKFGWTVEFLKQKLNDIGLRSLDLNIDNIGILTNDNIIHFDAISFETGNEIATSIKFNNGLKILKKGTPVIIDLDAIEVEDIQKYCDYLINIGYDKNKINDIKNFYCGRIK